jgi:hypothetical protein
MICDVEALERESVEKKKIAMSQTSRRSQYRLLVLSDGYNNIVV